MRPYIPKQDEAIPDYYGIEIHYLTGKSEELQVASHKLINEDRLIELVTHDDYWYLIPTASVVKLKFDKSFSRIVALKEKKVS